jgi:hypothetical protein
MRADKNAWHRNPLVWLVIAIPALTVAGCLLTIYLAISHPDAIERDYLEGRTGEPNRPSE